MEDIIFLDQNYKILFIIYFMLYFLQFNMILIFK